jgi:hypothetical protein
MRAPEVRQAILPAAAFQVALARSGDSPIARKSRLKAGCSQEWLPHTEAPHAG